ncbi:MAG: PatB family C-S lyase [Paracoccus sp. (in: a-proteobacteria)]|nr:PatB family C-S lyase [Paracoccus sp. (in: a-proteobacteria)]
MTRPDFDEPIQRVGTFCNKWDDMERAYGVSPQDGIAMWVADMDFRPPAAVQRALEAAASHGVYGYPAADPAYPAAIQWWMKNRHGWEIDTGWILTAMGLVNATALAIEAYTAPGDGVVVMSPVYHAFGRVVRASGRELVELPLRIDEAGLYRMDWEGWAAQMTGREKMLILCSPHNPGGRVWSAEELRQTAEFCRAHDLILVSDEIHHDLVMPGHRHTPMPLAAPDIVPRLVMLTAATKTFNIAGAHVGNAIIPDPDLRARFQGRLSALGLSPGMFGTSMVSAAYSPEGAAWVDHLIAYLDENRRIFDAAVNAIPGLRSMPLEATYLAWVDFAGTGMTPDEFKSRVAKGARIAANHGETFGAGGESFMRFNLATPRARVIEAAERLRSAFADLQ